MRASIKQIATCTTGSFLVEPSDSSLLVTGVTWDSRELVAGDLYVALPGERVDGHDFVADVLQAGASAALVSMLPHAETQALAKKVGAALICVPDTTAALEACARWWRSQLKATVIGITGSSGKTTTKNLIRDVLAPHVRVVATAGNQNNELGVPKTILAADSNTEVLVVEMGMRGCGQIAQLCELAQPDWGVITNVSESHVELLGSCENIARAKAELIEALPDEQGIAFLNANDEFCNYIQVQAQVSQRGVRTVLFKGANADGVDETGESLFALSIDTSDNNSLLNESIARVWAENVSLDAQGCARFRLCAHGFMSTLKNTTLQRSSIRQGVEDHVECVLSLHGIHNVANACVAAAIGRAFGISLVDIAKALATSQPERGRQEIIVSNAGLTVINDAYNANPDSMRAALLSLAALQVSGRRIAVLGDMLELGRYAQPCHEDIGRFVASLPITHLVCIGDQARFIAFAAQEAGMDASQVIAVNTVDEVFADLRCCLQPGDTVLVKASHALALERVVEGLVS